MGKRTERYQPHELSLRLEELKGNIIHVITWDDLTHTGTLTEYDHEKIVIQDPNTAWYNKRKHRHSISIDEIKEVIRDRSRPW